MVKIQLEGYCQGWLKALKIGSKQAKIGVFNEIAKKTEKGKKS